MRDGKRLCGRRCCRAGRQRPDKRRMRGSRAWERRPGRQAESEQGAGERGANERSCVWWRQKAASEQASKQPDIKARKSKRLPWPLHGSARVTSGPRSVRPRTYNPCSSLAPPRSNPPECRRWARTLWQAPKSLRRPRTRRQARNARRQTQTAQAAGSLVCAGHRKRKAYTRAGEIRAGRNAKRRREGGRFALASGQKFSKNDRASLCAEGSS